jgi:hypothetical protein
MQKSVEGSISAAGKHVELVLLTLTVDQKIYSQFMWVFLGVVMLVHTHIAVACAWSHVGCVMKNACATP